MTGVLKLQFKIKMGSIGKDVSTLLYIIILFSPFVTVKITMGFEIN